MANRLHALHGMRFEGIVEFMQEIQKAGFTNEFDNARVLKILSENVDDVWNMVSRKGTVYLTTTEQASPLHGSDLVVTVHASESETATLSTILFIREDRGSLSVYNNVLTQQVKPAIDDLPMNGKEVGWEEAEKIFKANQRFNDTAFAVFKVIYDIISSRNNGAECRMHMAHYPSSMNITYKVNGNKVIAMRFGYTN